MAGADPHVEVARLEHLRSETRRHFFGQLRNGIGLIALSSLLGGAGRGPDPTPPGADRLRRGPHLAPRARRVVYLHMAGSPPQQDLFDYKPRLNELDGRPCPDELFE